MIGILNLSKMTDEANNIGGMVTQMQYKSKKLKKFI